MPLNFRAEGHALGLIKAHNLFPIGAQVERVNAAGPAWRVAIYTAQPEAVLKYLNCKMPRIQWTQSEAL